MNRTEIANLEQAGRAAMAWFPEQAEGRTHHRGVAAAMPAAGFLAVAAMLLLAVL